MSPVRIAIVIDTLNGGGAEKVCLTLTRALANLGANAHLIVLKKKCDYELPSDINIHFLSDNAKLKLYKKSTQESLARDLRSAARTMGGFDLILSNLDDCHAVVSRAELKNTYYVVHNSIDETLKRFAKLGPIKYFRKKRALQSLKGKNVIAVSQGVADELKANKALALTSIKTIHNPIDIEGIASLSTQSEASQGSDTPIPDTPYIIHIGRFAKQKRHDVLFAMMQAWPDSPKLLLLTPKNEKLTRKIERYGISSKVEIAGFQQNPYPFIRAAQALVLCSDYEGFGLVIAEALACGTPVVSTDCPHGPNEILVGPLKQYLVPRNAPSDLKTALGKAISRRQDFAKPVTLERFAVLHIAEQYLELASA